MTQIQGDTCHIHTPAPGAFDAAAFTSFLATSNGKLGLDTEFTGSGIYARDAKLRLVQFATPTEAYVLDMQDPAQRSAALATLRDDYWFVSHASSAEASALHVDFDGFDLTSHDQIYDTLIVSLLIAPGRGAHDLKTLSSQYIDSQLADAQQALHDVFAQLYKAAHGRTGKGEEQREYGWTHISSRHPAYLHYAGLDAIYVRRLAEHLAARARELGVYDCIPRELRINNVATRMSIRGWRTDATERTRLQDTVVSEHSELSREYEATYGHLAGSHAKKVALLTELGVKFRVFTDKRNPKLGREELAELCLEYPHNAPLNLLKEISIRANVALFLSSLHGHVDPRGYVHPSIHTLGAVSGRWTVSRPGVQTVSNKSGTRRLFIPRQGNVFISSDLPQIEVRVAAAEAECHSLIEQLKSGIDAYAAAATLIFGPNYSPFERKLTKRVILGTLYGSGVDTLTRQAKYVDGWVDADSGTIADARRQFRAAVPEIQALSRRVQDEDPVRLASGRFVPVDPERLYRNINAVGQGNGRDYLMDCMLRAVDAGLDDYLIMALHDELLLDAPKALVRDVTHTLQECMSFGYKGVPTPSDIAIFPVCWGDEVNDA